MNTQAALPRVETTSRHRSTPLPSPRPGKKAPLPFHPSASRLDDESGQRQAELFYLQKQIQSQTPMVIVLADGETIEGLH